MSLSSASTYTESAVSTINFEVNPIHTNYLNLPLRIESKIRCFRCNKLIAHGHYVTVADINYHAECLNCDYCKQNLGNRVQYCYIGDGVIGLCKTCFTRIYPEQTHSTRKFSEFNVSAQQYYPAIRQDHKNDQPNDLLYTNIVSNSFQRNPIFECLDTYPANDDNCYRSCPPNQDFLPHQDQLVSSLRCSSCVQVGIPPIPSERKKRTYLRPDQLVQLRSIFEETQYPSTQAINSFARMHGITKKVVRVWFQNERARKKKQKS